MFRASSFRRTVLFSLALLPLAGCRRLRFPDAPADYREYAYVTSSGTGTVSILNLVSVQPERTLKVGANPTGATANPVRNEVYVVNTGDPDGNGSVSVIDTATNTITATIPVHRQPYFISVDSKGERGYVANSGSNDVSVLDLVQHTVIGVIGAGEKPGLAKISPDGRSLAVSNRGSGSISLFAVATKGLPTLRASFDGCPGATDLAIIPLDPAQPSTKVFAACSAGNTVMAVELAQSPGTWEAKQDPPSTRDRLLAYLRVGKDPVQLAVKPDGGEIFVSNFGSDSFSEISTWTNDVGGTYKIGMQPSQGVVTADNGTLWVTNFGADSISLYSIDDGRIAGSVPTGGAPDAIAMSADEHLVLAANSRSGDVAVIRTVSNHAGPELLTMLPAGGNPNSIAIKAFHIAK